MNPLDREARAARYLDAMDGLQDLLACRSAHEPIASEPLCQLFEILNAEAKKVVLRHTPNERLPGHDAHND